MEAHNKNALVSLSLTDEPIVVDVIRHSNQDKVKKVSTNVGAIDLHKGQREMQYVGYKGTCTCRCEGE